MQSRRIRATACALGLWLGAGATATAPAAAQDFFIFPNEGQTQEEQDLAEFQCLRSARERTGFDPMAAPQASSPAPQQRGSLLGGAGALIEQLAPFYFDATDG